MIYRFDDRPIISHRQERKSNRLQRELQTRKERKREELYELCTVDELIAMGFYEGGKQKPMPYGVEVWERDCTLSNENGWTYNRSVSTVALCLPEMKWLSSVEKFNPMYWEETKTHYWGFKVSSNAVALYCIMDLLHRIHRLRHWDEVACIPLRWRCGNEKCLLFAQQQVNKINNNLFALQPPSIKEQWLSYPLNKIRHEYTPYDYEWQTGKRDRDSAHEYWNTKIQEAKALLRQ